MAFWYLDSVFKIRFFYQQPWRTRPATRSTKLATGSARLATRSNRPATRSNRQAAQSSRPATRFSKPATRKQEHQTSNQEHHTREAKLRDPHFRSAFRVQKWSCEVSVFHSSSLSSHRSSFLLASLVFVQLFSPPLKLLSYAPIFLSQARCFGGSWGLSRPLFDVIGALVAGSS